MKRTVLVAGLVLALGLLLVGQSFAAPDTGTTSATVPLNPVIQTVLTTLGDDAFSLVDLTPAFADPSRTQHYGPYTSSSPDSGTCGPAWATDTFNRDFTVRQVGPNMYTVVEQFKQGSFVTASGPSPGSCDTDLGGTLDAGVTGSMHGYFIVTNVDAQTSTSPYCDALNSSNSNCTTTTFINTHFAPCYPSACTVSTYFDHYTAGGQHLAVTEWKNASCDRGGNQGDIASTAGSTGVQKSPLCP